MTMSVISRSGKFGCLPVPELFHYVLPIYFPGLIYTSMNPKKFVARYVIIFIAHYVKRKLSSVSARRRKGGCCVNFKEFRWPIVALSLLITLGILATGGYLFRRQTVDQPLYKLYGGMKEVRKSEIKAVGDQTNITIELADTSNLMDTYRNLDERTREVVGKGAYRIQVKDQRTPELEEVFYRVHFSLQESIVKGNFAEMAMKVEEAGRTAGLDRQRVFVDGQRLYLQLHKGDKYLYEIIPRVAAAEYVQHQEGGSAK